MKPIFIVLLLIAVLIAPALAVNSPPAKASIPQGALCGLTAYSYSYQSRATDLDGDKVRITFDWKDGTTTTTGLVASGTWVSASHKWPMGTVSGSKGYNIVARATDEHGREGEWSTANPISMVTSLPNRPPCIPVVSGPTSGTSGVPYTFSLASTDPDGNKIKYFIHWGDTTSQTGYSPSGQAATASHAWVVPAGQTRSYSITAYAVDEGNARVAYPYRCAPLVVTITGPAVLKAMQNIAGPEPDDMPEVAEINTTENNTEEG